MWIWTLTWLLTSLLTVTIGLHYGAWLALEFSVPMSILLLMLAPRGDADAN